MTLLALSQAQAPNPWMVLPFVALLAIIALAPLLFADWWTRFYPAVALSLGAVVIAYYAVGLQAFDQLAHTGHEYVSFICLIGSLYIVSGGIHIQVRGETTPGFNTAFLFVGALLANILGTTGASMLLIRPWIRMNKYRLTGHHIVFFIFIVSNVGGCLTPIGDPPLFLGYLKGIPFWWVAEHCWPIWAVGLGILLAMFLVVDTLNFRKAPRAVRAEHVDEPDWFRFEGLGNLFFLAMILGAILFAERPAFLREGIMLAAAAGSYFTTRRDIHQANHFNFHPVQEVAILFVGIFATMMPALDWLSQKAGALGHPSPAFFYWGCGILSSVLDNAPTYLGFLSAIFGAYVDADIVQQVQHLVQTGGADLSTFVHGEHSEQIRNTFAALQKFHGDAVARRQVDVEAIEMAFLLGNAAFNHFIVAISVGAVFFGANTYIGNGPNFMVKAIADHQGAKTPSFLGYIFRYSLPIMLPMLVVVWLIFFR
jgi:Na+/H+ antiporter NhaD/arsenite permease-like protein